ncbi:hypothetical protein L210DRAFT_3507419 [Boletus edulis BED1]|uniref:Uncharacterized protein n=1 Tax=Boletus edulis BED1 TaxID=1328754 RepID=A0AAD4BJ84_BOLED|nr:hypothetical protein L210DRAFT_3507419 [Boletus edulis BED1]
MVDEEKLEQLHEHDHLNLRSLLEFCGTTKSFTPSTTVNMDINCQISLSSWSPRFLSAFPACNANTPRGSCWSIEDPKQPAFPQTLSDSRPYLNLTIGHHHNSVLAHAGFTTRVMDVGPACPNRNLFAPGSGLLLVVMSNGVVEKTRNFNDECDCLPSGNSATLVINGVEVDTFMLSTVAQCAGTPTSYHSSQDNVEG